MALMGRHEIIAAVVPKQSEGVQYVWTSVVICLEGDPAVFIIDIIASVYYFDLFPARYRIIDDLGVAKHH